MKKSNIYMTEGEKVRSSNIYVYTYIHVYTHIYIYIHIHVYILYIERERECQPWAEFLTTVHKCGEVKRPWVGAQSKPPALTLGVKEECSLEEMMLDRETAGAGQGDASRGNRICQGQQARKGIFWLQLGFLGFP